MIRNALAGVAATAALSAGCSDGDGSRPAPSRPSAPALPAARSVHTPPPLGRAVALRKRYPFMGRERHVDAAVTPNRAGATRDPALALPAGTKPLRVAVRVQDRGAEPFPLQWARFALVNRAGTLVSAPSQTPVRRLQPDRRGSARATTLTFAVPAGFRPTELRLSSIVALWRFRAAWALR